MWYGYVLRGHYLVDQQDHLSIDHWISLLIITVYVLGGHFLSH